MNTSYASTSSAGYKHPPFSAHEMCPPLPGYTLEGALWASYNHVGQIPSSLFCSTAFNSKMLPLTSSVPDIDTPSSASSYSVLTPSSPPLDDFPDACPNGDVEMDEFEYDDEDEDSDYASEVGEDGHEDEVNASSVLQPPLQPRLLEKSSTLAGALGNYPRVQDGIGDLMTQSWSRDTAAALSVSSQPLSSHISHPYQTGHCDNYLSSVQPPSHQTTTIYHDHIHTHTLQHHTVASSYNTSFVPSQPSSDMPNHHASSSSSAIPVALRSNQSVMRPAISIPIHHPQPVRPIPPIPITELTASTTDTHHTLQRLPPDSLLYQPVTDEVRYQLKKASTSVPSNIGHGVGHMSHPSDSGYYGYVDPIGQNTLQSVSGYVSSGSLR